MKNFFLINKKNKGFTLVETLVAIAIFAFSITALISITATGVFNTNFVKNKFTASYLALEGAELVRNIRDTAILNDRTWVAIFTDPSILANCYNDNFCYIDPEPFIATPVAQNCPGICPFLNYRRGDNGKFNYDVADGNTNFRSIFRRSINIRPIGSEEVLVTSRVEWEQGRELRSTEFSLNLTNWAGQ